MSHDPRRVIENLREHLARHDKPLAFLFGAGTSAINTAPLAVPGQRQAFVPLVPTVVPLTARCQAEVVGLGALFRTAWDAAIAECRSGGATAPNIEDLLSLLRRKIEAVDPELGEAELRR